ncbi:MAG: T9SS type A sorting domain-containing protein [Calditrichaceae bacterium]|nr:T9SS type A sorting domain-containing protein [Calditrichaceae bacterium]
MAKQLLTLATLILLLVAFCVSPVSAFVEKGDTLVIQQTDQNATPLDQIIAADTLGDGSRKHLVYELVPDGWYPLSGTLTAGTYDLNIVGGKRTTEQSRPWILAGDPFGGWYMISVGENFTMKGVHFMQIANTLGGNIGEWARAGVEVTGVDKTIIFHDNVWDFNTGRSLGGGKNGLKLLVSNCLFRFNKPTNNSVWAGQGFDIRAADLDTVIFKNCTWYGGGPFLNVTWESSENLFRMDHCTIADWVQFPIHGVHYTNAEFTNMVFYNAHTMGEDSAMIKGQDPDGLPYGVLNIDTLYADMGDEANRRMVVQNNNNFVKQNIKDYWAIATAPADAEKYRFFTVADPTYYDGFMNSRTRAMFENDTDWPNLIHENTTSLDPQFADYFDYSDTLINYSKAYYSYAWPGVSKTKFMLDPDGEPLMPTDPMVYDLKVTNAALRTASTTGGVIGDLTWELENGYNSTQAEIATAIAKKQVKQPGEFALRQNYPNPFNPVCTISFNIPVSENVTLEVYNTLGQKVATILKNKSLRAGAHVYKFNGSNLSSGVYFYKLVAGDQYSETRKMMLLK